MYLGGINQPSIPVISNFPVWIDWHLTAAFSHRGKWWVETGILEADHSLLLKKESR